MSIHNFNAFPGSDKLESKLPGVSFVGTDKLTEATRASIEEGREPLTRGQKAAATRKANKLKREQEALVAQQEEELKVGVETITDDQGHTTQVSTFGDYVPRGPVGEADPSGLSQHTAGAKLDAGKIDMGMILSSFPRALFAVGSVGLFGAEKYSFEGWLEVDNGVHRYTSAGIRHLLQQFIEGPIDSDSKMHHLSHNAWNALAQLELYLKDKGETGEFHVNSK